MSSGESQTGHVLVQDLNVFYGSHQALRNVSVDVPRKQMTAVIGPSGCGKSTFLKCMNRLIDLTDGARFSGRVMVDGTDILDSTADVIDVRRRIGLLPQKPNPLPMSIFDNVAYGPRIHGTRDKRILNEIVEKYLSVAGLWDEVKDRLKSPAARLSLGQQQRLCLARGLAVEPEVILCDEPTSSLDPLSAQHVEDQLAILKQDYTTIMVTHNIDQAMRVADYVLHFYLGELVEHGPAYQVFQNPKEARTRAYVNGFATPQFDIDLKVDLRGNVCPYNYILAKQHLAKLGDGDILQIHVDDPTAVEQVPRAMEADGQRVLDVKKAGEHEWQIVIQKRVNRTRLTGKVTDYSI